MINLIDKWQVLWDVKSCDKEFKNKIQIVIVTEITYRPHFYLARHFLEVTTESL